MTDADRTLAAFHHGEVEPWTHPPVDEPDLSTWAWHRAAGAAVAVLTAAATGPLLAPPTSPDDLGGPLLVGGIAGAVVYTAGPSLALLERWRLRDAPVTLRRLRRFWLLATLALACVPAVTITGVVITLIGGPIALVCAWVGVSAGLRLPAWIGRPLAVAVPLLVIGAGFVAAADPSLVDAALALAVLVVVPAGVGLLPDLPAGAPLVTVAAGAPAVGGLLLTPSDGVLAGALTVPWVLVTAAWALVASARWWATGNRVRDAATVVACGYLAVGSLWLLADRLAFEPAGFGPPFVQLTAVHFTYAGFTATVLATRVRARRPDDRVASLAVATIVGAPPLVAVGFVAVGTLQIVGAVLLTVGTYALAWVTLRHVVPDVPRPAAWLLALSSVSVLAPMLLAVQWAVGANLGTPALSIPAMTATHGVANAVGFALLGVLGWHLVPRKARMDGDGGDG